MTRRPGVDRRGITLTEILISILIMGVGLISLATLFPLGMVRLRAAQQQNRSALLAESATADLSARNLLFKPSFLISWYGTYDPFTVDPLFGNVANALSSAVHGTGLPFCYDPLWRDITAITPTAAEARFGAGVFSGGNSFFRADPDGAGAASGYGLQRLTNFVPIALAPPLWPHVVPANVFASPDDPVMQNSDAAPAILTAPGTNPSPLSGVVPQWFPNTSGVGGSFQYDFRYTWLFTGYQVDATNATAFVGDVVVMDGRPFGFGPVASPVTGNSSNAADGETVLEAIFGYSANVGGGAIGYGVAADRTVLLRWPSAMPDPEIKVGSWIADVTYERNLGMINAQGVRLASAAGSPVYPFQRCYWYQVSKKSEVQADPVANYRRIVVTVNTPLKARTLLNAGGTAVNINVALFMPSVVNAFQRTIFVRTDR